MFAYKKSARCGAGELGSEENAGAAVIEMPGNSKGGKNAAEQRCSDTSESKCYMEPDKGASIISTLNRDE